MGTGFVPTDPYSGEPPVFGSWSEAKRTRAKNRVAAVAASIRSVDPLVGPVFWAPDRWEWGASHFFFRLKTTVPVAYTVTFASRFFRSMIYKGGSQLKTDYGLRKRRCPNGIENPWLSLSSFYL